MNLLRFISITGLILAFTTLAHAQQTVQPASDNVTEMTVTEKAEPHRGAATANVFARANAPLLDTIEASGSNVTKPQAADPEKWHFQLTPYLWIAGVSGRVGIANLTVDVNTGITDSDVDLNFGFMGSFEARKNKFIIVTDLQYSNLGAGRATPGPLFSTAGGDFKTFILDPEVGYRIVDNPEKGASIDVLGGVRFWHLKTDLTFNAGLLNTTTVTASRNWVDGVAGIRGKAHLSKRLFVTGKADLGGGGSNFTYQLFAGVGFLVGKRYALIAGYRDLDVNYNKDAFLFDNALHGPILGFGIKF
jgi:hypothetical protein